MTRTVAERLAQFTESLRFEDIPPEVVDKTRHLLLDTLGVCLGSTRLDFGEVMLRLVSRWGGAPEATLIGTPGKVSAQNAALCNGVLGHGQDYDDTHLESVVHPSGGLVPVALAAAERSGRSGRDTMAALVAGLETSIRIGLPALNRFHLRGFHTTSIAATFGAALTAAKLDGVAAGAAVNALGIAGSFTSGLLECIPAGSGAKRLHAGWAGLCGIVAAELAGAGYTGPKTVFEGKLGVYNSFLRGEELDLDAIFRGIGRGWEILNIRPKLYPCCHYLQAFIDAAGALRNAHRVRHEDIAAIACRVSPGAVNIVCEPFEKKLNPVTEYDVRFSLPFAVAIMLVKGRAGVAEFSKSNAADPVVRGVMSKVTYTVDESYQVKDMPAFVEIVLKNNARLHREVPQVRGDARNPVPLNELLEKFHANTAFLGRAAAARIADEILRFERLPHIQSFMMQLASAGASKT